MYSNRRSNVLIVFSSRLAFAPGHSAAVRLHDFVVDSPWNGHSYTFQTGGSGVHPRGGYIVYQSQVEVP